MSRIMTHRVGPLAALFVILVGLVAYGKFVSHPTTQGADPPAIVADDAAQDERNNLEIELITLRPEGFEPLQIVRPKGPFVLLVDDRSGKEGSSLRLQRIKGEHLREININRKKSEWYDLINLPPGEYVLSDAENPERRCQITLLQ